MNLPERIREVCEQKKISIRQLETLVGTGNGTIGKAIQRGSEIPALWLEKILLKYPEIRPKWLLLGIGGMEYPQPDVENSLTNEDQVPYGINWKMKYLETLEKYNQLLIDYSELLKK